MSINPGEADGSAAQDTAGPGNAREALAGLLPMLMAVAGDPRGRASLMLYIQVQMLFWTLDGVVDGLEALKGVAERARDRLRDVVARIDRRDGTSAEW